MTYDYILVEEKNMQHKQYKQEPRFIQHMDECNMKFWNFLWATPKFMNFW
jgi:hypothetical protein